MRKILTQLSVKSIYNKRTSIAMYEAEINVVIHGNGGTAEVEIFEDRVKIFIYDEGRELQTLSLR